MHFRLPVLVLTLSLTGAAAHAQNMTSWTPTKVLMSGTCPLQITKVQVENNGTSSKVGLLVKNPYVEAAKFTVSIRASLVKTRGGSPQGAIVFVQGSLKPKTEGLFYGTPEPGIITVSKTEAMSIVDCGPA